MAKKETFSFRVTYLTPEGRRLTNFCFKKTKQAAARSAFRKWIRTEQIRNQPRSTAAGWFENVTVHFDHLMITRQRAKRLIDRGFLLV